MAKKITEYIAEIQRLFELEPEKQNLLPEMQMLVALKNIGSEKGMEHEIEDEQLETEVEKLNKNGELDKFFKVRMQKMLTLFMQALQGSRSLKRKTRSRRLPPRITSPRKLSL